MRTQPHVKEIDKRSDNNLRRSEYILNINH